MHIYAARYPIPKSCCIIGVNMRFELGYWKKRWDYFVNIKGKWRLEWKNRGVPLYHEVSKDDIGNYAGVDLREVSSITVPVINIYGILPSQRPLAHYEMGEKLLADGVVPFSDIVHPANLIKSHTLCFIENVGHYLKEEEGHPKLYSAVKKFLLHQLSGSNLKCSL